jgi:hypothetical protein
VRLTPAELQRVLIKTRQSLPEIFKDAAFVSGERSRATFVRKSPVDTGRHRASWKTKKSAAGVLVENDAPYAGIIERGARPHAVSEEGREAITRWAMRKFGISVDEAEKMAQGIINKLRAHGQKGTFVVEKNLDNSAKWLAEEITRLLTRLLAEKP